MDILDAAKYLIYLSYEKGYYSLTPLKLQKILYYAQGWSFVWDGVPLFEDTFEAWQYGPVNRKVYDAFKGFRGDEIPQEMGLIPAYADQQELDTLSVIWDKYGPMSANTLVEKTHLEGPWINALKSGSVITTESIKEYFQTRY